VEWMSGRGNRSTRRKPAPMPLCPPHILHDLTRGRTLVGRRDGKSTTVWVVTQPTSTWDTIWYDNYMWDDPWRFRGACCKTQLPTLKMGAAASYETLIKSWETTSWLKHNVGRSVKDMAPQWTITKCVALVHHTHFMDWASHWKNFPLPFPPIFTLCSFSSRDTRRSPRIQFCAKYPEMFLVLSQPIIRDKF
jgi:hypothetical protein